MYVAPRRCIATFSSVWENRSSFVPGYRLRALLHRKYVSVAPQVQRDDANSFRFLQNCKIFYYSSKAESIETDRSSNLIKIEERNDKVSVEAFNETWVPPNRPFVGHTDQPAYSDEVNEQDRIEREQKSSSSHFTKLSRKQDGDSSDHEQNSKDVNSHLLDVPFQQLETDKFKVRRPNNAFPLKIDSNLTSKDEKQPDWLKLRRSIFGNEEDLKSSSSVRGDASPCKMYTLLSANEIVACIESLGGKDITLILDRDGRMGGPIGIILVTSNSIVQMNRICELLVYQLRRRKLHECNIVGASLGIEGKVHRDVKATKNRNHWLVVDCGNYVVHVQDDEARQVINLESLWSGSDPLFQLNCYDEDEVEDYLASHPVPECYNLTSGYSSKSSRSFSASDSMSFTDTIQKLQKSRHTVDRSNMIKGKRRWKQKNETR